MAQAKSITDGPESHRKRQDADDSVNEEFPETKRKKTIAKKQENATLLFNAMRTTAAQTQSQTRADPSLFNISIPTENQTEPARSSTTPGATSGAPSGPVAPQPDASQEGDPKPPPGGGKKKRKREFFWLLCIEPIN